MRLNIVNPDAWIPPGANMWWTPRSQSDNWHARKGQVRGSCGYDTAGTFYRYWLKYFEHLRTTIYGCVVLGSG